MNKLELLAKLLKEDKITVQEFAILVEPTYVYNYTYPKAEFYPFTQPYQPNFPYTVTC